MKRDHHSEKKNNHKITIAVLFVIGALLFAGCSSGSTGDDPEASGENMISATSQDPAVTDASENGTSSSNKGSDNYADSSGLTDTTESPAAAQSERTNDTGTVGNRGLEATAGNENDNITDPANDEGTYPGEAASNPDGEGDDGMSDAEGSGSLLSEDESPWTSSFLLFLPRFDAGVEGNHISEETFDHIIIGGIDSKRVIEDYVEEIKAAGFNVDADYVDHNGNIDFHAYNKDGWYATVDYDIGTGKADIACGFFSEKEEKEPGTYFSEEILAVVPMPEAGTLSSGRADKESPYALYEECTLEDAKVYAKALVKAGFDKEVEEGEADGVYWYNAEGPDGIVCDMQYADGMIVIICGKAEE